MSKIDKTKLGKFINSGRVQSIEEEQAELSLNPTNKHFQKESQVRVENITKQLIVEDGRQLLNG
jgi:hypothetical protein